MQSLQKSLLILGIFVLAACSTTKKSSTTDEGQNVMETTTTITDRKWRLVELNGKPVADKINGKEPFLQLHKSDNRYTGSGGCNGLGGTFTLEDKGRIKFSQGMSTMMACENMEIEQGLNKALIAADNYTLKGDTLALNKARMASLARFVHVDTSKTHVLNGTWEVDYLSGTRIAFDGLFPNKKPTLHFDLPSTKATGSGSCNTYNTSFTMEGNKIKFGKLMSTEMACEGDGEAAFFKILQTVTQYSVTGNTLNLIMGDIAVIRLTRK